MTHIHTTKLPYSQKIEQSHADCILGILPAKLCLNLLGRMIVSTVDTWQRPVSCSSIPRGSGTQDYSLELCDLPVQERSLWIWTFTDKSKGVLVGCLLSDLQDPSENCTYFQCFFLCWELCNTSATIFLISYPIHLCKTMCWRTVGGATPCYNCWCH